MRPLHRPMFRYGGPIKEGVMSGIREPRANGGTIAGGNQIGIPMGNRTGFQDPVPGGSTFWSRFINQYRPRNLKWSRLNPFKKAKNIATAPKKIKGAWGILQQPKSTSGIAQSGAGQTFLQNLKSFSFPGVSKLKGWATKGKDLAIKYPKSTIVGGAYVGPKIVANVPTPNWSGSWGIKDILVPDEIYNYETGRWFNPDDKDVKPEDRVVTGVNRPGDDGTGGLEDPPVVIPQKSADEIRAERIQKYRDIMDIKGMNKRAAYDSLIDASKLVSESGDFKGDIKSGKLINEVIQATSKQFDKPSKTKDAIDTLILKGEIEADIAAGKPSTYLKTAQDMVATGAAKNITEAMKTLTKSGNSMSTTLGAIVSKGGRLDEENVGIAYRDETGNIPKGMIKESEVNEWIEDNPGKNELDYTKELITNTELAPGDYVIGTRVVTVDKDNKVSFFY